MNRILVAAVVLTACGSAPDAPPTAPADSAATPAEFQIAGDPESAAGATWTYQGTAGGVTYDLRGILRKPVGRGPFPAVIVSHGNGGSATGYARGVASTMVGWGAVVIATNYTHAGGVPVGAPGDAAQPGASAANVLRARRLLELLRALGYVDLRRVAAHGHSMGAFVTTATAAAAPDAFLVASHTAGGVRPDVPATPGAAPTDAQAATLATPYQMHHGDADRVVALPLDQRLADLLRARGVPHELRVYAGADHDDVANDPAVLERVRQWYATHGLFRP